jgi:hypothetical protein
MVVISAWACRLDGDGPWQVDVEFYPVLAIVAETRLHYVMRRFSESDEYPPTGANHAEMLNFGWRYSAGADAPEFDVLIYTDDYGILPATESLDCDNEAHETHQAPWDPSEDAIWLVGPIERLKAESLEKAEKTEARHKALREQSAKS